MMIEPEQYGQFQEELREISQLRHRVFAQRLSWVESRGGCEIDEYDSHSPTYLAYCDPVLGMIACVRMLPTTGPYMLKGTFPQLLGGIDPICEVDVCEASRFCVDTDRIRERSSALLTKVTSGLFLAMVEFGLHRGCQGIVTVTDLRVERLVRMAGWPTRRLSDPMPVGSTDAVAILGAINIEVLHRMRGRAKDQRLKLYKSISAAA